MSLDQMIADAKKRLNEATDDQAKLQAAAEVEALGKVLQAGYTKTQEDLNAVDKQNREKLETFQKEVERLTGPWDEFKETLANIEQQIVADPDKESATEDPSSATGQRILGELRSRDEAIQAEREARQNFERELRSERLTNNLNERFKDLGLQEPYYKAAREFVSPHLTSIVEKAMQGEEVEEDLRAQAERVKELSGVWFEQPRDPATPPPPPGVPASPNGGAPRELTDEERAARSESVI